MLIAAAGALSASQALSSDDATAAATGPPKSLHAKASADPSHDRRALKVSRSSSRPSLDQPQALTKAAKREADARAHKLRSTATSAKSYAKALADSRWDQPTTGYHISTWFGEAGGYWASGYHTGIDFATGCGTPVTAVTSGTISEAGYDIGGWAYGNQIRLRLSNGDEVWYNHLSEIEVSSGETVVKGQELGLVGETGNAYGCHLHFEYRLASDLHTAVDPEPYLDDHGIHLR